MVSVPGWYSPSEDESPDWGPCPECGTANAATARFCQACGRPLADPGPAPESITLETLTAVVAEIVSASPAFALSADAGERIAEVRETLVGAGGIERELPGNPNTVAAVFGPAPGDGVSTMTAIRAAIAARDQVTAGDVALRLGIGASDVRADDEQTIELWRGRVVDLAVRLSRMAGPGEVILGEGAYRLVRGQVHAEAVDPRADPDGDDVGPLRLHDLAGETDQAWAADARSAEPDAGAADVSPADAAAAADQPEWTGAWNEAFGPESSDQPLTAAAMATEDEPMAAEAEATAAGDDEVPTGEETSADLATMPSEVWGAFEGPTVGPDMPSIASDASTEPPAAEATPFPVWDTVREPDTPAPDEAADASATTPLLERDDVLGRLHEALDRALADGRPVAVTLGGDPGSGRTSLARWFAGETAGRAWTVEIGCRRPEAGGTTWPFAPLVRALLGVDGPMDRDALDARLRDALRGDEPAAATAIAAFLDGDDASAPDEVLESIARLVSATISRRPLVLVVDDADRPPAAARSLFDAMVAKISGPLLAVLVVRDRADVVAAPLSDEASAELVERLLARPNLPPDAIASIVRACRGIPLAVEHLVAMLADDGHLRWEYGRWAPAVDLTSLPLPADLSSLIARRVGGLTPEERRVAAVAAVGTEVVDVRTLASALGDDIDATRRIAVALDERGILRRVDDDRFSFGHDVIAEVAAAYVERDAARKMHLAGAEALATDRIPGTDVDEAIGAHLERALRTAGQGADRESIGRRAANHLVRAARGAADVGDEDASLALLRRAASLLPAGDPGRARLLLDAADALNARDERAAAERLLGDAIRAARAAGDDLLEVRANVARARLLATASRLEEHVEALREAADAAIVTATAREDEATAAAAWSARGWVHAVRGHFAGAAEAFAHAAAAWSAAGRRRDELAALRDVAAAIVDGPAPVDEAIDRGRWVLDRVRGTAVEPVVASAVAVLLARAGRRDDAHEVLAGVAAAPAEQADAAAISSRAALVELHADDVERAESWLAAALDLHAPPADRGAVEAWLAYVLTTTRRTDDAMRAADAAASLADPDDVLAQVTWRAAKARCLAATGRTGEARALVRLALRLADQTDLSELRARTRLDLAEVLLASGRANEAGPAARAALRALERKGSVAEAGRARAILDRVAGRPVGARPGDDTARLGDDDAAIEVTEAPPEAGAPDEGRPDPTGERADHAEPPGEGPETNGAGRITNGDARAANGAGAGSPGGEEEPAEGKRDRRWFW